MPRQARALATRAAILEAAAQILERHGMAGFNTNAVAERAGIGIGTLYQYFRDKNALILAIASAEIGRGLEIALRELAAGTPGDVEARVRTTVRAVINAFGGRQRARRAILQVIFAQGLAAAFREPLDRFTALLAARLQNDAAPGTPPPPGRDAAGAAQAEQRAFVLSRAVIGAIRAAVLEERSFLHASSFEDELVRLVLNYLELGGSTTALPSHETTTA